MYDVKAHAVRNDGVIQVTIMGNLPNSCYQAEIKDMYPGGNIAYVADPGHAQVFIEEKMKPGHEVCLMLIVPWIDHISIPSGKHDQVFIYINGNKKLTVDVKEKEPSDFQVIAPKTSAKNCIDGHSIIPSDAPFLDIYSPVFGPASRAACEQWKKENLTSLTG